MENQIFNQLTTLNIDFAKRNEQEIEIKTILDIVKVKIKLHRFSGSGLQVHHLEFFSDSISTTGYKSHFIQYNKDYKLDNEEMAYILATLIEQLQVENKTRFEELKTKKLMASQLVLF